MANKYSDINGRYLKLERDIILALKFEIENSKVFSKFIYDEKALKINIFDYVELIINNGVLTFLDSNGNHYNHFSECTTEDLINILISKG